MVNHNTCKWYWTPGHADVYGNNIADNLANEGSNMSKQGLGPNQNLLDNYINSRSLLTGAKCIEIQRQEQPHQVFIPLWHLLLGLGPLVSLLYALFLLAVCTISSCCMHYFDSPCLPMRGQLLSSLIVTLFRHGRSNEPCTLNVSNSNFIKTHFTKNLLTGKQKLFY